MGTFDSSISKAVEGPQRANDAAGNLPDLGKLTAAENKIAASAQSSPLLQHLEIGGLTTAAGGAAGGVLGSAYGALGEAAVQVYKYPLAAGIGAMGGSRMAADLLRIESNYLSTASHYGVRGLAIGLGLGAAAFTAYEVKNYFEK